LVMQHEVIQVRHPHHGIRLAQHPAHRKREAGTSMIQDSKQAEPGNRPRSERVRTDRGCLGSLGARGR
jgi:hypothetical protein